MKQVSYAYPNGSEIAQRGGLLERWQLAKEAKCEYIESPADFIKNSNEMQRTGLALFSFLDTKSVEVLYSRDRPVPSEVKYILHTEPSLPRDDGYGVICQTPLKWYDRAWVDRFIDTSISISRFLGLSASMIEVHPGDSGNSYNRLLDSLPKIRKYLRYIRERDKAGDAVGNVIIIPMEDFVHELTNVIP